MVRSRGFNRRRDGPGRSQRDATKPRHHRGPRFSRDAAEAEKAGRGSGRASGLSTERLSCCASLLFFLDKLPDVLTGLDVSIFPELRAILAVLIKDRQLIFLKGGYEHRVFHCLLERVMEGLDHVAGHAFRPKNRERRSMHHLVSQFTDSGSIRKSLDPLVGEMGQEAHLAGLAQGNPTRSGGHEVNMPSQHRGG